MRTWNQLLWLTLFSIAMAYLESAVVVYIRELLYPGGFDFPLAAMKGSLAVTEIFREAATIIMLLGAGIIAGKRFSERFAWFLYCFAVWDIFYYVFLKLLIGWPDSLMTWDVLFLIPVTWTGPVITPLLVCVYMLVLSGSVIYYSSRGADTAISKVEWYLLISGALVLIIAFTWDYSSFIVENFPAGQIFNKPVATPLFDLALSYVPRRFNWILFSAGSVVIVAAVARYILRIRKS